MHLHHALFSHTLFSLGPVWLFCLCCNFSEATTKNQPHLPPIFTVTIIVLDKDVITFMLRFFHFKGCKFISATIKFICSQVFNTVPLKSWNRLIFQLHFPGINSNHFSKSSDPKSYLKNRNKSLCLKSKLTRMEN